MHPIVVLGASGKTGRRIVERLRARDIPVRLGSRSAQPPFDWNAPHTWRPALEGTSAAYVSYFPDLAAPGAPEAIEALAGVAIEAGVERLVLLSGRGEEEAQRSEDVLMRSGAAWTVVRSSWFSQNFSEAHPASHCWAAGSRSPPATSASRLSTPTTSPTWRSRRSPRKGTSARSTR
jgi:uncharacterized protein YbjT (DUF2867 family)